MRGQGLEHLAPYIPRSADHRDLVTHDDLALLLMLRKETCKPCDAAAGAGAGFELDIDGGADRMAEAPDPAPQRPGSYAEFWPRYLAAHRRPGSRALHFAGTLLALALVVAAIATGHWWLLLAAPVVGYAGAWIGHFAIEGNRPETFGHPLWSLFSDVRMLLLWLLGRLDAEFRRHGVAPK